MSGEEPEAPEVDVVEVAHKEGAFSKRQMNKDTEDASWDKGVFAGQSDQTAPMPKVEAPDAKADKDFVPNFRKPKTEETKIAQPEDDDEDDDDEIKPAVMFAVGLGGSSLVLVAGYAGLTLAGVL